jgi:UDP-N-acetylglucosamine 2-epimerase (non-hydrolysing)
MAGRLTRLMVVVGTRPNFMKAAPLLRALGYCSSGTASYPSAGWVPQCILVHTGQHYDSALSDVFFRDLDLPEPDVWLGIQSAGHAEQTARALVGIESAILERRPDLMIVFGDVNSTLAGALAAAKLGVPVAHVEAGLRSYDRAMPEELNRVLTDYLSELLFTTSQLAVTHLRAEGIPAERIRHVGNIMIDALDQVRPLLDPARALAAAHVDAADYAVATFHRPSNVDGQVGLERVLEVLRETASHLPVVLPLHPRTAASLRASHSEIHLDAIEGLHVVPPMGYVDFMSLVSGARVVVSDSGGVQAETTVLGVQCITLRTTTEQPETIEEGSNHLVPPRDRDLFTNTLEVALTEGPGCAARPPLWDGHTAGRIAGVLRDYCT